MNYPKKNCSFCIIIGALCCIAITAMVMASCCTKQKAVNAAAPAANEELDHSPTTFIVMYDSAVGKEPLLKAVKTYGARVVYDYGSMSGMALSKPKDKTLEETMLYFRKVKGVTSVNYDHINSLDDPKPNFEEVE